MSLKINRIASTILKEVSLILRTEVKDQNLSLVNVTACDLSNDLSVAKIYYTVFDEEAKKEVADSLKKARGFIRTELSQRIQIRHTPELRFIYDESVATGERIEEIIEELQNK